jgi:adenine-specific DNA-methyltransferase
LDRINESESEEFHKNLVSDFLKNTYYGTNHYINTKGRNDLVIHNTNSASGTVGVIVEAKKPTNKAEMIRINYINTKADTTALESEIDQLVYQLYGLTEEEIKIVENS